VEGKITFAKSSQWAANKAQPRATATATQPPKHHNRAEDAEPLLSANSTSSSGETAKVAEEAVAVGAYRAATQGSGYAVFR
jgi:hypothetical protein